MPKRKVSNPARRNLEKFRVALLAERDRLRESLRSLEEGDTDTGVQDAIDVASDVSIRDVLRGISMNEGEQLRQVEAALEKIDAGTYGTCQTCGKPIEAERLRAIPFALYCVACKRQEEQRAKAPPRR